MGKRKTAEVGELWIESCGGEELAHLILKVEKLHREVGLDYYSYLVLMPQSGITRTLEARYPIRERYTAGCRWYKVE